MFSNESKSWFWYKNNANCSISQQTEKTSIKTLDPDPINQYITRRRQAKRCWQQCGEVSEWLKEHAWKVCIRQRIEGSNPSLTAISLLERYKNWRDG